jgi:hypothetical protein
LFPGVGLPLPDQTKDAASEDFDKLLAALDGSHFRRGRHGSWRHGSAAPVGS